MSDFERFEIHARSPIPVRGRLERGPGLSAVSAVAVGILERSNPWRLAISCEMKPGHPMRLAELIVPAPLEQAHETRLVCIACAPGARGWMVEATPIGTPPNPAEVGAIEIAAADVGPAGIEVFGRVEIVGRRRHYTGGILGAGNTNIPITSAQRIRRVSLWQDGTGAAFTVAGGPNIDLPPFGAATLECDLWGTGATAVQVIAAPAGGAGILIEYEE